MFKRKVAGTVLAAALAFGSIVPSFAANITIDSSALGNGSVYSAYRLLDLTTSLKPGDHGHDDGSAHGEDCYNYSYTVNSAYREKLQAALAGTEGVEKDGEPGLSDSEMLDYLSGIAGKSDEVRAFADNVWKQIKDMTADASTDNKVFSGMGQGYYLIAETQKGASPDSVSLVMLDTAGQNDITVKTKEDVPVVSKEVQETSDAGEGEFGEAADADIGDHVKFRLTGTMPANIDSFKTYKYVFHDNLSDGLAFDADSVVVKIDGNLIDSSKYSVKVAELADACDFEVAFADVKDTGVSISKDSKVVVEYTATLGANALLKTENEVKLEFSADPYYNGEGEPETSETPPDKAVVFTYTLNVDKVTKDQAPLAGADFKVMKWDKDANDYVDYVNGSNELKDGQVQFTFKGLDAGKYKLVETKTPDGYNAIEPIEFEITSELEGQTIKSLSADHDDFSAEISTGTVATKVVNETGSILPSTGGAGTYAIYGVGALLAIGGVTLVFTRRKKTSENVED